MQTNERISTGCKVNLFLRVLNKRPDRLHNLETFFLPLRQPSDILNVHISQRTPISSCRPGNIVVSCSNQALDLKQNTLIHAYKLYQNATGFLPSLAVHVTKHVPIGGGLGGGSANAAGLLLFLQKMQMRNNCQALPLSQLYGLAAQIGADVPFFLANTPVYATGTGNQLLPSLHPFTGYALLLVCPNISISTVWAFTALAEKRMGKTILPKNLLTSAPDQAISLFARERQLHNDFEEIVFESFPALRTLKKELLWTGAEQALLSGTGSSIFALFKTRKNLQNALQSAKLCRYKTYEQTV